MIYVFSITVGIKTSERDVFPRRLASSSSSSSGKRRARTGQSIPRGSFWILVCINHSKGEKEKKKKWLNGAEFFSLSLRGRRKERGGEVWVNRVRGTDSCGLYSVCWRYYSLLSEMAV